MRAVVFIDGGHLDAILKCSFDHVSIDHGKFAERLVGADDLVRVYYYDALPFRSSPPEAEEEYRYKQKQRFLSALKYKG